jgi:hypothetical protein
MEVGAVAVEVVEDAVGLLTGVASMAALEELEAVGGLLVGEDVVGSPFLLLLVVVMAWGLTSPTAEFALKTRMYRPRLWSI